MLQVALYSNDSDFLIDFGRDLNARLGGGEGVHVRRVPMLQTSLFDGTELPADVTVVDIRDDPQRGMDFVEGLERGPCGEVMVVAAGPELAMRAYDADVMAYLTDPGDTARAAKLIQRRFSRRAAPGGNLNLPTEQGVQVFPAERTVYLEYENHRLILHDDRGGRQVTKTMRASFGDVAEALAADPRFVRTHAAFIVNVQHVERVERRFLVLDTGDRVPVAKARRKSVRARFGTFFEQA